MKFDSSLLIEKDLGKVKSESLMETENTDNYFHTLLEFNEEMHKIDVADKINYYRLLKEASLGECTELALQENIISTIRDYIAKAIQAIIDFIKKIFGVFRNNFDKNIAEAFEKAKRTAGTKTPTKLKSINELKDFKFYMHLNLKDPNFDNMARSCITRIIDAISGLCNGEDRDINGEKEFAYKAIYRVLKKYSNGRYNGTVNNAESFKEFIKTSIIYTENKKCSFNDFNTFYKNKYVPQNANEINTSISAIQGDLEKCKRFVLNATDIKEEYKQKATTLVSQLKEIVDCWVWYTKETYNADMKMASYYVSIIKRLYSSIGFGESGMIHGEPFDGDTLFDNEDIRDFNPTEWLDLQLESEFSLITHEWLEAKRRIAVNEALIMTEGLGCVNKLIAMREAEGQNLGNKFADIMKQIKAIIDDFLTNFRDQYSFAAMYINKHKELIDKPFKFTGKISSTGDILKGLERINAPTNIDPFNYDLMKDKLKDDKTFFSSIAGKYNNCRLGNWNEQMTIAEYCKAYFGASVPEDKAKAIEFTAAEILGSKDKILEFLKAPNALIANIKKQLNTLESESKKIATKIGTASAGQQPNMANQNNEPADSDTKHEGYYSELYNQFFNEVDFSTANAGVNPATGEVNNSEEVKKNSEEMDAFKVYLNVYRTILMAKITAAQFIRKELFAIIKYHAESYMSKEQKAASKENDKEPKQIASKKDEK